MFPSVIKKNMSYDYVLHLQLKLYCNSGADWLQMSFKRRNFSDGSQLGLVLVASWSLVLQSQVHHKRTLNGFIETTICLLQ